ncbi:MAG: hypothetical protein WCP85_03595 [Mariniphaga sp.]
MKIKLLSLIAFVFLFTGCNKIKDATTLTINTKLEKNLVIDATSWLAGMKSGNLLAVGTPVSFSKTQDLTLDANVDLASYTSRIKQINLNSVVVTVTGLPVDQTINSVKLNITGVGDVINQTNITSVNNSFSPVITTAMFDAIEAKLTADRKITITVSGSATSSMTFTVGISIDSSVVVYTIQ